MEEQTKYITVFRRFVWVNRGKHLLKECIMFFKDSEKITRETQFQPFRPLYYVNQSGYSPSSDKLRFSISYMAILLALC